MCPQPRRRTPSLNGTIAALALLLAACGGGTDKPPDAVVRPRRIGHLHRLEHGGGYGDAATGRPTWAGHAVP
jgi:hypothetical protein